MFCTSCGAPVSDEHRFCSGCGRSVRNSPATIHDATSVEVHRPPGVPAVNRAAPPAQYSATPPSQSPPTYAAPSPVYVTQQVQVAAPALLRPAKSVGLAIFLGFVFGPFGLFYASPIGGLIMLIGGIIVTAATVGVAAPFVWITCAIWAGIAANNYNSSIISQSAPTQINRY